MKKVCWIIGVLVIIIIVVLLLLFSNKTYEYNDKGIPGSSYKVKVNTITKKLSIETSLYCSTIGCEAEVNNCSIKLTSDEYKRALSIWDKQDSLSPILDSICANDKVMYKNFDAYIGGTKEEFDRIDTNKDGKITSREFANDWLNTIINEK